MLENFTSRNSRDFRQRYEGTYGFYVRPEDARRTLVVLNGVGDTQVTFTDAKRQTYFVNVDQGIEFEFIPLVKKLFYYAGDVCFIRRLAARQFQRGVCQANTSISRIEDSKKVGLSFAVVAAAYAKDTQISAKEKEEFLENKRESLLVSPMFAFVKEKLFLYETPVAVVQDKALVVKEPIFRQEVADMVEKHSFPYSVEI